MTIPPDFLGLPVLEFEMVTIMSICLTFYDRYGITVNMPTESQRCHL